MYDKKAPGSKDMGFMAMWMTIANTNLLEGNNAGRGGSKKKVNN